MSDNFHSPSRYTNLPVSTIRLKDARFGWRSETGSTELYDNAFTTQAISAEFGPGLNLICGPTGSGKTLLLLG
jgi:type II secretory ATPase GspE/PulE/Tfp pilus assembly ATPase PilB-like protein